MIVLRTPAVVEVAGCPLCYRECSHSFRSSATLFGRLTVGSPEYPFALGVHSSDTNRRLNRAIRTVRENDRYEPPAKTEEITPGRATPPSPPIGLIGAGISLIGVDTGMLENGIDDSTWQLVKPRHDSRRRRDERADSNGTDKGPIRTERSKAYVTTNAGRTRKSDH
ncbi:hypothetical protein EA473_03280 [Natrarchaeobius chitinivorans]|uniref:Uncharacterized protein n=1 Tax=Natrarchaeobius chitinivorans TaxID=1679083 RepID=A0A3N6MJ81_NATCH|nr:hypothetical protein EA473_03280 [Natrarchaeobius chitinivorans]